MKRILLLFALIASAAGLSQPIAVSTTSYSVPQLVNSVLINSPCVSATNVTWKTGTTFASANGIGFFQNTNPRFPMASGVILSTGNAMNAAGPNTTDLNDGNINWDGDSSLEATLAAAGIPMNSVNATVLEFDFNPISPQFSFDFLFASEEYGNFQCEFSDAFAFLLTNMNTGVTTNLAVVPGTNQPISVVTIRDFLYNSTCPSVNAQFFGSYNGGSAASASPTNFNGQTKMLNASAVLMPNTPYHIKLVIADRNDNQSDSAIFISSDSFNIGQDVLGQDLTVAGTAAVCTGQSTVLNSNLNPANYNFSWKRNGIAITGAAGPTLTVTQPGLYEITYQNTVSTCVPITDSVTVEFYPEMSVQSPINLYKCPSPGGNNTYDLSQNTPIVKDGLDPSSVVSYHSTLAAANANTGPLPLSYASAGNQTVFVRIKNGTTPCYVVRQFELLTIPAPVAHSVNDLTLCARSATITNGVFFISRQTAGVLGGQSTDFYNVTYHLTQVDANSGSNPQAGTIIGHNGQVIYVRIQNATDPSCFSTTTFTLHVNQLPPVDTMESIILCEPYTLPAVVNGNYFTGPNGTGDALSAGDIITETATIYIFNQPGGPDTCSAASSFKVTIIDPLTLSPGSGSYCGSYTLPGLDNGDYFTGPNGTGTKLPAGTVITESQLLHVFYQSTEEPFCAIDTDFDITILHTVNVGEHPDVFDCTSYTLPWIPAGNYYTEAGGMGTQLPVGTEITATQTIRIFATSPGAGGCPTEKAFTVFIGLESPPDISQCNGYTLPELPIGNYYTAPAGTGTLIPAGTVLEESAIVYIYIPTSHGVNCTDNVHFTAHIAQSLIDHPEDIAVCGNYMLPELSKGEYFTEAQGAGTQLHGGDIITTSQTIYVFKRSTADCYNEDSFTITVSEKPAIDSRSDIDVCNSYTLTALGVGNYYTGPGGTGDLLPAGTVISTSQRIYIYARSATEPYCEAENNFMITAYAIRADHPADVISCDGYTLPPLSANNNYYRASGGPQLGEGNLIQAGTVITTSARLYIYTESGERINCTDESNFLITINASPVIPALPSRNACNSYTLPTPPIGNYYTGSEKSGTQLHEGDVITATQTIYVYAETGTAPNCYDEKSFTVNIFNVDELPNITICEGYTLPALTNGRYFTGTGGTGSQIPAGSMLNNSQTVYVYGTSPFTPSCYDESSFTITIVDTPVAHGVARANSTFCDEDGVNDGVNNINLTALNSEVLGNQIGSEFTVAWYGSQADAAAQSNPITSTTAAIAFVRVNNTLTANCYDINSINFIINRIPEPDPKGGIICYDTVKNELLNSYTLHSQLSPTQYSFQWFNEAGELVGNHADYEAVLPGEYSVIATSNLTGCASAETFATVSASMPAIIAYSITEDFADSQSVVIEATGTGGDYEYQLDFGPFQDSPVFDGVSSGIHSITVRDKNGCGLSVTKALVVNYPKYFTPNNDGFHDTWNITDLNDQPAAKISIFDRYGKMLTQIRPDGPGWDGTFGGRPLPSTDYWFTVLYSEDGVEKEFKAHFAMKR